MYKKMILLLISIVYVVLVNGLEGDRCNTRTVPGTCTSITECPSILNDIRHGKRDHVVCGYNGFTQVVCCPSSRSTAAPTTAYRPISNRISAKKCNEYKEFAYSKIYVSNVFSTVEKKVSNCGFKSVPLIVGGTEAKRREFPHMALIGFKNQNTIHWDCGGTLISEQFVLTAGHCFESRDNGPARYVRLGDHDLKRTDDAKPVELEIIERIPHPKYKNPIQYNDIGLFKLERKVEFNEAIRPACLPEQSAVPTKTAIVSGWGAVEWRGDTSNVLLKVILDMFTQSECNSIYMQDINRKLNKGIVEETQVCAGSHTEEKDSCQGDSGGPLQIYHESYHCTYIIVGVTSFGKACATVGVPGVYTRVYNYLNWIESVVWPNQ